MSSPGALSRRALERRLVISLVTADLLACAAAEFGAYGLRLWLGGPWLGPLQQGAGMYLLALPLVWALWLLALHSTGLYDPRRVMSPAGGPAHALRGVSSGVLLIAGASFLSHTDYSRAVLLLFWLLAAALTVPVRWALGWHAIRLRKRGTGVAATLVVGCGELGEAIAERSQANELLGFSVVGLVQVADEAPRSRSFPVLGRLADLPSLIRQQGVEDVFIAHPGLDTAALMTAVYECEGLGAGFHVVGGALEVLAQGAELAGMGDLPVVELRPARLVPWQQACKRVADLVLGALLLALAAPLIAIVGLLVASEDGGAMLFRQRRVGLRGREFVMLKLRTMEAGAQAYANAPERPGDARVTRAGRWLRRTSLDELPQLVNVLRGEMSLVGPRPEMPYLVAQYEPWQRLRLDVKPGLTGLWQVMGRKDLPLRDNLQFDFYYVRNWSVWLDLSILLRTISVVVVGRGAY
jgi:exopolysaccharide biosynthesis polyprenyl glycosylphosphotransferase